MCWYAYDGLAHRVDVLAALVRERGLADVRRRERRRDVGDLRDVAGDLGEPRQLRIVDDLHAHLELQVGDQRAEVRVAGALAVAVDAALHLDRTGADRGERRRDGAPGVVVTVNAGDAAESRGDVADHDLDAIGKRAAVGVAERDPLGAGADRRLEAAQRVVGVAAVSVEEVLGVVHHAAAVVDEPAHRVRRSSRGSRRSVVRSTSTTCRSHALPTSVMIGAIESSSVRSCRSSCGAMPGPPGRAERGERRVAQRVGAASPRRTRCRSGLAPGHPPSMTVTPSVSRCSAMRSLSDTEKLMPDSLRAVAQRRVVDLDAHDAAPLRAPRWRNASRATASATASVPACRRGRR